MKSQFRKKIKKAKLESALKVFGAFMFASAISTPAAFAINPGGNSDGNSDAGCNSNCSLGIDPTSEMLEKEQGPYVIDYIDIPKSVAGFAGGRIHFPKGLDQRLGLVVIGPGFLYTDESSSRWLGPRLASNGFVTVNINFNTVMDQPDMRANQYDKALDYVIKLSKDSSSPLYGLVDENRLGAAGWSMGGGAALKLSNMRPLKAIMPWAPWYIPAGAFSSVQTPSLIIACKGDIIAPEGIHASAFYNVIPDSTPKEYVKFAKGNHWCSNNRSNYKPLIGKLSIAWFKRFMDEDNRYEKFICDGDIKDESGVAEFRDNCGSWK